MNCEFCGKFPSSKPTFCWWCFQVSDKGKSESTLALIKEKILHQDYTFCSFLSRPLKYLCLYVFHWKKTFFEIALFSSSSKQLKDLAISQEDPLKFFSIQFTSETFFRKIFTKFLFLLILTNLAVFWTLLFFSVLRVRRASHTSWPVSQPLGPTGLAGSSLVGGWGKFIFLRWAVYKFWPNGVKPI